MNPLELTLIAFVCTADPTALGEQAVTLCTRYSIELPLAEQRACRVPKLRNAKIEEMLAKQNAELPEGATIRSSCRLSPEGVDSTARAANIG